MDLMDKLFFNNSMGAWLTSLAATLILFLSLNLLMRIILKRLSALAQKTENTLDDLLIGLLRKTNNLIIFVEPQIYRFTI